MTDKRKCTMCEENNPDKFREKGRQDLCKQCINSYERKRRANSASHKNAQINNHLKREYGITLEGFNKMLVNRSGVCAICKKPENPNLCERLSVDHDHETGKVRGLLCRSCNTMLGIVKDSPERLRTAANYLESGGSIG